MYREDLEWEMITRPIHGNDRGLTPLEKKDYDKQRAKCLKDVAEGHQYEYYAIQESLTSSIYIYIFPANQNDRLPLSHESLYRACRMQIHLQECPW